METMNDEEELVRKEIQSLLDSLPTMEAKVLHKLQCRQDQPLMNLIIQEPDQLKRKYALARLIVEETVSHSHNLWKEIFQDYSTDHVKQMMGLSQEEKKQSSLTYGEIDFFSFANILERAHPSQGEVFVDLGHGIGKGIVCAAVLYGHILSRLYGVEIIEDLYTLSMTMIERCRLSFQSDPIFSDHHCELQVDQGDLLSESIGEKWTTADIVFANSTCFDDQLMQSMARVAESMKPGSRFITLTKQLPSSEFILLDRRQYVMSWGEATSFLHVRKDRSSTT